MSQFKLQQDLLKEAAAYFNSHLALQRLLAGFMEKYRKYGRIAGVVVLEQVTSADKEVLESFFRRGLPSGILRISAQAFLAALAETRFGSLEPLAIIEAWRGTSIVSRQEERAAAERKRRETFEKLMAEYRAPVCQAWLKAVLAKESSTRPVQAAFRRDSRFALHMAAALKALGNLPGEYRRLPVFAREVCGNPHGLDIDTEAGKLFLAGLKYLRPEYDDGSNEDFSNIEEISELLYHFKLLRDDLLNMVSVIGLAAYDSEGEIAYWRSAAQKCAPLNAPLREIVRAEKFYPAVWKADGQHDGVLSKHKYEALVVENSGVFSALLDENMTLNGWQGKPLICLHGQPKFASWALLDRLATSGATIYYSGDFDPEGLKIAEKLLLRYPENVRLWCMTIEDYLAAEPSEKLDTSRLAKLRSTAAPELIPLIELVNKTKCAAYQEALLNRLGSGLHY